MAKLLLLVAILYLAAVVKSNDVRLGYTGPQDRKIYSEIKEADPALWKRTDDVIINAGPGETISAIYVTDLRDDKDGEAFVESGGIGLHSVTIGLKSPTILRGYKFEIQVYASVNQPYQRNYLKGGSQYNYDDTQYARKY